MFQTATPAGLVLLCTMCLVSAFGQDIRLREVLISSSIDGAEQPAHFYAPPVAVPEAGGDPVPLLVSLHSWSADYRAYDSYQGALEGCVERGWAFISPSFRGPNAGPDACASDLAVQDVLDAVAWAGERAHIDADRIYILGGSGGGHMALVMAHRAPEVWAAVSAWVPITDLSAWHAFSTKKGYKYAGDIEQCLGGPPGDAERDKEYRKRSPLFWLHEAKGVAIDIQSGIHDGHGGRAVPIDHSLRAFNVLAEANGEDAAMLSENDIEVLTREARTPERLKAQSEAARATQEPREHPILFRRSAGPVRLTLFDGGHVIDPPPALDWLGEQRR